MPYICHKFQVYLNYRIVEMEDTYMDERTEVYNQEENNTQIIEDANYYSGSENNYETNKKPKKNGSNNNLFLKALALIVTGALIGGLVGGVSTFLLMTKTGIASKNTVTQLNPASFEAGEALTAPEAFAKVAPAVVIVSTKAISNTGIIPKEVEGMGSGFIINEDGYIITNYHVIEGAKEVTVTLSDKREVQAKVVNFDQEQDMAMLKIVDDIEVPAVVELGDSDALIPGEDVIAIGTPLSKDFSQTLTKGVVSATNRTVQTDTGAQLNLIQTDTPINPGNSGGPLVNTKGEVIGINTLKLSSGAEGMGFAIPINEVKGRIDTLSKPILNLGVSIRVIDEETAKARKLEEGLYVVDVVPFSPAEKAGIKPADLITNFDGKRVKTLDELKKIKDSKNEGDVVKVDVIRDSKKVSLDLTMSAN